MAVEIIVVKCSLLFSQSRLGSKSPKRTSNGGSKKTSQSTDVRLLTLDDLEKEYMLINMSLRLASNGCKQIIGRSVCCFISCF
jgi:hypothetical protein